MLMAANDQRQWWWYADELYWDNERYHPQDVHALLHERTRRRD